MHPLLALATGLIVAWVAATLGRDGWASGIAPWRNLLLAGGLVALLLGIGAVLRG